MTTREEQRLSIPRSARLFVEQPEDGEVREAWFVLHGYGQLADEFLDEFEGLARPGRLLVAPEGLARFYREGGSGAVGASWMTKVARQDEIDDYVRYLDAVHAALLGLAHGVRVVVLGFSQGGATACRWTARGQVRVDRVISWAGGVPPDLGEDELARLARADLTLVVGARDAYLDARRVEAEAARLTAAGVAHRLVRFEGGHRLDRDTLARLAADAAP